MHFCLAHYMTPKDVPRFLVIGPLEGKQRTATCTLHSEGVRIISVRRSGTTEVMFYEGARNDYD